MLGKLGWNGFASDSLTGCLVDGRIRTVDVAACIALRFALRFFAVASRFLRAYYEYGSDCGYRSTYDEKCLAGGGGGRGRSHERIRYIECLGMVGENRRIGDKNAALHHDPSLLLAV